MNMKTYADMKICQYYIESINRRESNNLNISDVLQHLYDGILKLCYE